MRAQLREDDPILQGLHRSMEQELERIFRLMALLFRGSALHDAYVGLRSTNSAMRANALEFLDNVLVPDLRKVLVPLLDNQVSVEERIEIADLLSARRSGPRKRPWRRLGARRFLAAWRGVRRALCAARLAAEVRRTAASIQNAQRCQRR